MALLQCDICGGKLMAKSGGIFECEYCGMQYDKTRIQEMVQEIKGTVKVEGTVEVTGSVKIDGPVKVDSGATAENFLKLGQLALERLDWQAARLNYKKALDVNAECAEAYFGLTMCEEKVTDLDSLVRLNQWTNQNYTLGKRFADGNLRKEIESREQAFLAGLNEEVNEELIDEIICNSINNGVDINEKVVINGFSPLFSACFSNGPTCLVSSDKISSTRTRLFFSSSRFFSAAAFLFLYFTIPAASSKSSRLSSGLPLSILSI